MSLKDPNYTEKILKIKSLMKEGIDMSWNLQRVLVGRGDQTLGGLPK